MSIRPRVLLAVALWVVPHGAALAQVDISGEWAARLHEDRPHRLDPPGPSIGDYAGLPLNDAARLRADSWDASIYSVREHQTQPSSAVFGFHAPTGVRITKVIDDTTQQVVAYRLFRAAPSGTSRTIWMDGRAHPPAHVAHTWMGFSTGRWSGAVLTVETTHLKVGWIQRNGVPHSDRVTVTEHFVRHGNYLTVIGIIDDPVYLEEPLVRSWNMALDPDQRLQPSPVQIVDEIAGLTRGYVPHHLPGTNQAVREFAEREKLPFEATRGGRATMYPEYQDRLRELGSGSAKPAQ
jgi:hypothetical protein